VTVTVVAVVASALLLAEFLPQPVRLWRTRSVSGISVIGSGITFVTELGWLGYGITTGLWVVTALAAITGVLSGIQLALVWHRRTPTEAGILILWAVAIAVALPLGVVGVVLVLGLVAGVGPQAWTAWRSPDAHGVSVWRWGFTMASGAAWATYGILVSAPTIIVTGALACALGLRVLWRFVVVGRHGAGHPTPR
jgi:uncharacterized protein with PQ loop repeat